MNGKRDSKARDIIALEQMFNPKNERERIYAFCECLFVYARLMYVITRNERDEWLGKAPHKAFIL